MTNRPYNDCLSMALALCGIPDSSAVETARIGVFLNGRARKAYAASQYWPRWLKVEERICSEDGLLPYEETDRDTIKTVLRIHASEPYAGQWAGEYANFVARADGIQIAGYQPSTLTEGDGVVVSGTLSPDVTGTYTPGGDPVEYLTYSAYRYTRTDNSNHTIFPAFADLGGGDVRIVWEISIADSALNWSTGLLSTDIDTPDQASGEFAANNGATGTPVLAPVGTFSVWVTYKAAFTESYVAGEEVPEEWFDYMAHGAYADFLRNEGQQEKAALAEAEAQSKLDEQLEQIDRQSGGHVFTRVINHGNTQAR